MPSLVPPTAPPTAHSLKPDRLSMLPNCLIVSILSLLDRKDIAKTCVLAKSWRSIWKEVPVVLWFDTHRCRNQIEYLEFLDSINEELRYCGIKWRKIKTFGVEFHYRTWLSKDLDYWIYSCSKNLNVDKMVLLNSGIPFDYPEFAFKSSSLKEVVLFGCNFYFPGKINWNLMKYISLQVVRLDDLVVVRMLGGCPNLEILELHNFGGISCLAFSNRKLSKLIIDSGVAYDGFEKLVIDAPNLKSLEILGQWGPIQVVLRDIHSLTFAMLDFAVDLGRGIVDKECVYALKLIDGVRGVRYLTLGAWLIEVMTLLEVRQWRCPKLSYNYLQLNTCLMEKDFLGFRRLLESTQLLETLVIDMDIETPRDLYLRFMSDESDEEIFLRNTSDFPLPHLKIIKIINVSGTPSFLSTLVAFMLRNATVLEKLIVAGQSETDVDMEIFQGLPKASPTACVVICFR